MLPVRNVLPQPAQRHRQRRPAVNKRDLQQRLSNGPGCFRVPRHPADGDEGHRPQHHNRGEREKPIRFLRPNLREKFPRAHGQKNLSADRQRPRASRHAINGCCHGEQTGQRQPGRSAEQRMQPHKYQRHGGERKQRLAANANFSVHDHGFLLLPPMTQADRGGNEQQRIPPRRRGVQKMEQPRGLGEHQKSLAEQRDFADAQQINGKSQRDRLGGEHQRQMFRTGVKPRCCQPNHERQQRECCRLNAERRRVFYHFAVRRQRIDQHQRAEHDARPQSRAGERR